MFRVDHIRDEGRAKPAAGSAVAGGITKRPARRTWLKRFRVQRVIPQAVVASVTLQSAAATAASAQIPDSQSSVPGWVGHFSVFASNTLLGALTGGIGQALNGGRFDKGFASGALGGAIVFAGKEVASQHFDGAGLLGREMAAIGSSVAYNASQGMPLLGQIYLPVGPLPVQSQITLRNGFDVHFRLKVVELGYTIWALAHPDLSLDMRTSLSFGVPVFNARAAALRIGDQTLGGAVMGGVMVLPDRILSRQTTERRGEVGAHERVHILQWDFVSQTWNRAMMETVLDRLPFGSTVNRIAVVDGVTWLPSAVMTLLWENHDARPHELEAIFLAR